MSRIITLSQEPAAAVVVSGAYPGQAGNPVGHTHAPGYPGSLTLYTGDDITVSGTAANPIIYQFKDFINGVYITASHIKFIGCRFQAPAGASTIDVAIGSPLNGAFIEFDYCSFVPPVSLAAQPPNGGGYTTWPTGGTGLQCRPDPIDGTSIPSPCQIPITIPYLHGYQYSLICGGSPVTCDHCDFWGFGNSITTVASTGLLKFQDCWIHDSRYPGSGGEDHTDGIGYLDGAAAPQNVVVDQCVIAAEGVEDGLAAQGSTNGYTNWTVNNCYLTGWDYAFEFFSIPNSNCKITNNTFGTEVPWTFAAASATPVSWWAGRPNGNQWSGNTLKIYPGTSDISAADKPKWTSVMNGYFVYPDGTYHATDFV